MVTAEEVKSALTGFKELGDKLSKLDYSIWGKDLKELLEYCESNKVMCIITSPLSNMEVGLDHILDQRFRPRDLTQLSLPDDVDERLAFIYQFLWRIHNKLFLLSTSSLANQDLYNQIIHGLHQKFVVCFLNEMQMRLGKINLLATKKDFLDLKDLYVLARPF